MSDLIDKQEVLRLIRTSMPEETSASLLYQSVAHMPSAQPDIIHCKDCKHYMPFDWAFHKIVRSKDINDYASYDFGCTYCGIYMGANDFCSRGVRKEDD